MPSRGGAAGKSGDQYESLWTVDAALRVVSGQAESIIYESLDAEESRGVEFNLNTASGDIEFWSLKRQTTTAAGWTLATLVRRDEHGRSILGDLIEHVQRDSRNIAVFASTLGAANLEELRSVSEIPDTLAKRLDQSKELKSDFEKYLLPLFNGKFDQARIFLTRLRIRTVDEVSLRSQVESTISLLFYCESGGPIDAAAVRRLLAEFMLDHMHQSISRTAVLEHLACKGYRRKDWKVDSKVREKVAVLCESYTEPFREHLIFGTLQILPGAEKLLEMDGLPTARVLLSGSAGGGKSSELAHIVDRLRATNVPVLPVRMDQIEESVLTPEKLGEVLSLPASPVTVLAGLADGGDCVLVIDQLDAVSLASGRRAEVWSLFGRLLNEADKYPKLRIIVACREFDIEHDYRMRSLTAKSFKFKIVALGFFEPKQLNDILGDRKVHPKLKLLLVVPLHLAMFLSLGSQDREQLETRDDLFSAFWARKRNLTSQRLGRTCDFAGVLDQLAGWLSGRQELSAPEYVFDTLREDADALASEGVLVFADGRYRFFHETFFDYAFARSFARKGGGLVGLLLSGEQHLFRRAQVRQVLSFLRSNDPTRYIDELRSVLTDARVRFHVKRLVFHYLASATKPIPREWEVLYNLEANPELPKHVYDVVAGHPGWFDVLDSVGYFELELSSGQSSRESQCIRLLGQFEILRQRSARVAALLSKFRRHDETWKGYLRYICRTGETFYSREMFDLFISLIGDGTLDGTRPGFAINDTWWSCLYSMAEKSPSLASEAIGSWFDRKLKLWDVEKNLHQSQYKYGMNVAEAQPTVGEGVNEDETRADSLSRGGLLQRCLEADGNDLGVIANAAAVPIAFVEQLLHRVVALVDRVAKAEHEQLQVDPLWSFRVFGDEGHKAHESIFGVLAQALETLAGSTSNDLDRLLDPHVARPHDSIAYLVLRAWTAAPKVYAERLAMYLAEDPRRLNIGYIDHGGVESAYRSIEAIRAASSRCSPGAFAALEAAIVRFTCREEARHLQSRGLRQLRLLSAMDQERLGPNGQSVLAALQAKFPNIEHQEPEPMTVHCVGSPIEPEAQKKMNFEQWISAMETYAGKNLRTSHEFRFSGGEYQLAQALEECSKNDSGWFINLAVKMSAKMPANLPASYFDAIIRGVTDANPFNFSSAKAMIVSEKTPKSTVVLSDVVGFVELIHGLPNRPCGLSLVRLIEKWKQVDWPFSVVEAVAWYATNDPDPKEEIWCKPDSSGNFYYRGDPFFAGLNSTRGAAAGAVATLLFSNPAKANELLMVIRHLAHDSSLAVRSHAIGTLIALLNTHVELAIRWFIECVSADPILLGTQLVERFVYFAGLRDYISIRPILQQMLLSSDEQVADTAARICCLLALRAKEPEEDAQRARTGSVVLRKAAAAIYGGYVAHHEVGALCRSLLKPFFADPDDSVRTNAAQAFRHIGKLEIGEQGNLLEAFLEAKPGNAALRPIIRALEDSPVQLPDLVCRLVELGVEAHLVEANNPCTAGIVTDSHLSKIVIRLYTQSVDENIRRRCLDAIDRLERVGFFELSKELQQQDR